jgi:hypothetical protein
MKNNQNKINKKIKNKNKNKKKVHPVSSGSRGWT